jgi:adenosyl cobinamide kinase/adenosyl cobinamide phosphate guanylyltransferase
MQEEEMNSSRYRSSKLSHAKEISTIRFGLPRQSGHSTFAQKLINEEFKNAIYIAMSMHQLYDSFIYRDASVEQRARMGTLVHIDKLEDIKFDAVIVDCASLYSKKRIDEIYNFFKHAVYQKPYPIFLFLE